MPMLSCTSIAIPSHAGWAAVVAGLGGTALAGLLVWAMSVDTWHVWPHGVALVLALVALVLAPAALPRRPIHLRAEMGQWVLSDGQDKPESRGSLTVALDLGAAVLLHFESAHGRRWLPVHRRHLGASWHAMRLTVYSARARKGGQDSGDRPQTEMNRPD